MNNRETAPFQVAEAAREVFDKEIQALILTRNALGKKFEEILRLIIECQGKVVVTGMGKPGHVGTKIAATFASLGTPAFFMHPAEAMHGDLGMVEKKRHRAAAELQRRKYRSNFSYACTS